MILILSHAWALDAEHARAYVAITEEFGEFHAAQRGFRGRRLVRDLDDTLHFINLRWWDHAEDYEAMIHDPAYPGWIARLSEHVHARSPEKLLLDVVVEHPDPGGRRLTPVADIVALHGAFRGGWCWDLVRSVVERDGHRLFAPDLTGMGAGPQTAHDDVTLQDWISDIVEVVAANDLWEFVLVGHSMGGVVARAALGALGDRVARVVFIDSPRIMEGQRAVDVSSPTPPPADLLPPRSTWLSPTPVGAAQGFDPPLAVWVNERLCATPFGPQLDPCPPIPASVGSVPRTIAFCSRTPDGSPATLARARCEAEGIGYVLLDCHHDAPLVAPRETARLIIGH